VIFHISDFYIDLVNIFESFLPQLLRYPNAADPLNGEAAALLMESEEKYGLRVRNSVLKYASADIVMTDDARKESSDTTSSSNSGADGEYMKGIVEDDLDDNSSDVSDMSDL